jgi:hypothetical protein
VPELSTAVPELPPDGASVAPNRSRQRIAFLVIHGVGQQRPYEPLDEFSRGLLSSFESDKGGPKWKINPELDICPDPSHAQKDWVRASYRVVPDAPVAFKSDTQKPGESIEDISLFEYYWAPITQDKITYTGSLLFLILAGLRPFLFLGANINAISTADTAGASKVWLFTRVVFRELVRQVFLFVPLLLLLLGVMAWLASMVTATSIKEILPKGADLLVAILCGLRLLFVVTNGKALFQSLNAKSGWQRSNLWRIVLLGLVLFNIFAWPRWTSGALGGLSAIGLQLAHWHWLQNAPIRWSALLAGAAAHTAHPAIGTAAWMFTKWFLFLDPGLARFFPKLLWLLLAMFVRYILVDYVGDVAVYVNANELAKNFAARSQILDECTAALTGILKMKINADPASPPAFDQVYVAGHSLGSAIAYDTINALLDRARTDSPDPAQVHAADLDRLRGMVTFGSPLNKFFYFFREQIDPRQALRTQTLDLLHGFRVLPGLRHPGGKWQFEQPTNPDWLEAEHCLDHNFRWINAYSIEDPISGRLIFYDLQDNLNQQGFNLYPPLIAHLRYWKDPKFYAFLRSRLL